MKQKLGWKSGSLHSHGEQTDCRNFNERKSFTLNHIINTCAKAGRDFQAVLDIMANQNRRPEFQEDRYEKLIETRSLLGKKYEVESSPIETKIIYEDKKGNEKEFYIIRTQEIIAENTRQHVLALNLDSNISGGGNVEEILKEIKGNGGYAFLNHPFVCGAFEKNEILDFYNKGLILGTEFNGGVTIDSKLGVFLANIADNNPPLKKDNEKVLDLEREILIVANDDARCKSDIKKGAYTEYLVDANTKIPLIERLIESMQKEIDEGLKGHYIIRHEKYSKWSSIWMHGVNGIISQMTYGENSLPKI